MDTLGVDDSESASYGKSGERVRKKWVRKIDRAVEDGESRGKMTNDEARMTKEIRMTNDEEVL